MYVNNLPRFHLSFAAFTLKIVIKTTYRIYSAMICFYARTK